MTLSWLAGATKAWHLLVRLVKTAMMSVGLGWATGTARPRPERAVKVERRASLMTAFWGAGK